MNTLKRCLVSLTLPVAALAVPVAALAVASGPAHAHRAHFQDRAGDAEVVRGGTLLVPGGLDITRVSVDNRSGAVSTTVTFAKNVTGDLFVVLDPRHGKSAIMASRHHKGGTNRNFVESAFRSGGDYKFERVHCNGFRVTWTSQPARARLWMPASCFNDGHYGAVRVGVGTEDNRRPHRGMDVDTAPNQPLHGGLLEWRRWIKRG